MEMAANVEIHYAVDIEEPIGRKNEGMMCLPAGSISFGDLKLPGADELSLAVNSELPGEIASVAGTIDLIMVKLCTPWKGILKSAPKGSISISVKWIATSLEHGGEIICKSSANVELDGKDPRKSAAPMLNAVSQALLAAEKCLSA